MEGKEEIFDVDLSNSDLLDIIKYQSGDMIRFSYSDEENPVRVTEIE